MSIDFDGLAARLLSDSRPLLESWFPAGKWRGREFVVGNLAGDPGESLSINSASGRWKDFSSGDAGGDLISLYAARNGMKQADAARELGAADIARPNGHTHRQSAWPPADRAQIMIPPDGTDPPLMKHPVYGRPTASWPYRDATGIILGYVARHDPPDTRKQIVPWTWSGTAWQMKQFAEPRPLYGLDLLAARPTDPVLLVEGEKTADAGRRIAGEYYVVVTWPGGGKAWTKTDFTPLYGRPVLCLPDADLKLYPDNHPEAGTVIPYADQPGQSTMIAIAAALAPHCDEVKLINVAPGDGFDPPDGWDIADTDWTWDQFRDWAKPRISVVARPSESEPEIPPDPDPYVPDAVLWTDPIDLFCTIPVPDIDLSMLPDAIGTFAHDQATIIGCDPSVLAISCLAVAAGAINDGIKVQPHEHNFRWRESARIWCAIVGDPSTKKSPAMSCALAQLKKLDIKLAADEAEKLQKHKFELAFYAAEEKKYIADRGKSGSMGQPIPPESPMIERLIVEDITIEKLSEVMKTNPRGVLRVADELSGWFGSMDAYKSGAGKDRADWLETYNGGSRRIDRIARGTIVVPNWSVCMLGGIQPDAIRKLASTLTDDGMLQRFMVITAKPGRPGEDRRQDDAASDTWDAVVRALYHLPAGDVAIQLSPGARDIHGEIVSFATEMISAGDALPAQFRSHLGKWEGLAPRLMLIYHLINCTSAGESPWRVISEHTAGQVHAFMTKFLFKHALHFYNDTLSDSSLTDATRWIAGYILAKNVTDLTTRDLSRHCHWWKTAHEIDQIAVINRLTDFGWIQPKLSGYSKFKRLPTSMMCNPAVHVTFANLAQREREKRQRIAEAMNRSES